MKLSSAFNAEPAVFTDEELLQFENEFLRDQIEIQELENSIELMETLKACIEKEGGVSSSIEVMFGENFSSKENALTELNEQLTAAYESAFNKDFQLAKNVAVKQAVNTMIEKLNSITMDDLKKLKYPVTINISKRSIQLGYVLDAMEETVKLCNSIKDKADYEARKAEIEAKGGEIVETIVAKAKEAKAEPCQISSADEFLATIKEGTEGRKKFKPMWAALQKSIWDMNSKMGKITGMPESKNDMIRGLMLTYRTILRCLMQNGREILRAVGK